MTTALHSQIHVCISCVWNMLKQFVALQKKVWIYILWSMFLHNLIRSLFVIYVFCRPMFCWLLALSLAPSLPSFNLSSSASYCWPSFMSSSPRPLSLHLGKKCSIYISYLMISLSSCINCSPWMLSDLKNIVLSLCYLIKHHHWAQNVPQTDSLNAFYINQSQSLHP